MRDMLPCEGVTMPTVGIGYLCAVYTPPLTRMMSALLLSSVSNVLRARERQRRRGDGHM
jgi:hypothetical protein